MRAPIGGLLLTLTLLLPTGCLSAFYTRQTRFEPPPEGTLTQLAPGQSDLGQCLALLGAPLWVWEHGGSGAALAYGWLQNGDWNVSLQAPISNNASASFTFRKIDERMRGVVLFFDEDWQLRTVRKGLLRDLTAQFRDRRPSFLDSPR